MNQGRHGAGLPHPYPILLVHGHVARIAHRRQWRLLTYPPKSAAVDGSQAGYAVTMFSFPLPSPPPSRFSPLPL